jgi:hypothetical protein
MMSWLLVPVVPVVLGGLFAAAAMILAYPAMQMRRTWVSTRGTVVDVEEFESGGTTVRRIEVRFTDMHGCERVRTSSLAWGLFKFEKGAEVPLFYDPENPAAVQVGTFPEVWLLPTLVGAAGTLAAGLGLCFAISLARGA